MRFACVQFDIVWEDKAANHAIIERMLAEAQPRIEPGTFVLLPELGDTGFSMDVQRIADERTRPWAMGLAKRLGVWVQCGFARLSGREAGPPSGSKARNVAAIVSPEGQVVADYEKVHPFSYGREADYFSGGDHIAIARCGEAQICPFICYDLRFPELWRLAAINQPSAEVFTIGACWPSTRQQHWRSLCIARAIENQAFVVACNRCGRDPTLGYAGGSMIVAPTGEILAEADDQPCVLQADVNLETLRVWRDKFPALRDVHRELLGRVSVQPQSSD